MNYREKMDAVEVEKDDSLIDCRTGKARDGFAAGHRHARHQCAKIAAYADGEIERLTEQLGHFKANGVILGIQIDNLHASIVELTKENHTLKTEVDLHREIRKLRK